MPTQKTILITGATGQQGGAVAAELAGAGFQLKGMTRKPDSPAAQALRQKGVTIVEGDLNDEASLRTALAGAWGVFAVQNTWEADVQHYVYSSVGSAHHATGIPHFENKWRIEDASGESHAPAHGFYRHLRYADQGIRFAKPLAAQGGAA